ncbi:hypothetical protein ACRAWF_01370 [Streptomyces sp. L7]
MPAALVDALRQQGSDQRGRPGLGGLLGGPTRPTRCTAGPSSGSRPGRRDAGARPGRRRLGGPGAHDGVARRPRRGGCDPTPDQAAFAALTGGSRSATSP